MEPSSNPVLKYFKEGDVYGILPPSNLAGIESTLETVEFISIGTSLPWAWILTGLVSSIVFGIGGYKLSKVWNDLWVSWRGIFSLFLMFIMLAPIYYLFVYFAIFVTVSEFSIIRSLKMDAGKEIIEIRDQNFLQHSIPYSEISHIAYVPKKISQKTGLWLVRDHRYEHGILRWDEDPLQEEEFLSWAEDLAKTWGTILVPYHERPGIFRTPKFQEYLSEQGLKEKIFTLKGENGDPIEDRIHWEIESIKTDMDRTDWNYWLAKAFVMLLISPILVFIIVFISIIPKLFMSAVRQKNLLDDEGFMKTILRSRITFLGVGLIFVWIYSTYDATTYVKSADTIRIELGESSLKYSIQNPDRDVADKERMQGWDFWLGLFLSSPLDAWDQLMELSRTDTITMEVNFSEVNKFTQRHQEMTFYKIIEHEEDPSFDLRGLDPLVYQYILTKIRKNYFRYKKLHGAK